MVNKKNLQNLVNRQVVVKPFLYNEALRKINFLEDSVMSQEQHKEFTRFNYIIDSHEIFCGTDSELDNLRELVSLLKVM